MKFKSSLIGLSLVLSFLTLPSWAAQTERRVMILPFKNLTRVEVDNWLGDSFSESLLMGLGHVHSLKLVERTELAQIIKEQAFMQSLLADPDKATEVGKLIGADQMILGSYQKIGNRIQVNVRLVNVSTGEIDNSTLTQIQGPFEELFELQEDLARQLIQKLKVESNPTEIKQMQARIKATKSTRAQEFYQKAKGDYEWSMSNQQMQTSIENYQLAVAEDPNYALAWSGLSERLSQRGSDTSGLLYKQDDDLEKALKFADKALKIDPELGDAYRARAKALHALKREHEALLDARKSIEFSKNSSNIIWYLGLKFPNYRSQDILDKLEAELKLLQADFEDPLIQALLASQYINKFVANAETDLSPAIQLLEKSYQSRPNYPPTLMLLASLQLIKGDLKQNEYYLMKVLEIDPDNPVILYTCASLLRFSNKDKALELIQKSLQIEPDSIYSHLLLIEMYQQDFDDFEAAFKQYQTALKLAPENPNVDYSLAQVYFDKLDYQTAIAYAEKAVTKTKNSQNPHDKNHLGFIYKFIAQSFLMTKQEEQARRYFELALAETGLHSITRAFTHKSLAQLDMKQQRYESALAHFTRFMQQAPGHAQAEPNINMYRLLYLLVQEQKGNATAAALNDIAQGFYVLNEFKTAQEYYQRAISLEPTNPVIHYNLGLLYLQFQNKQAAQLAFEQALSLKPDYIKALFSLGQLAQEQGHKQLAKDYFASVLKLDPQHERARAAFDQL